MNRVSTRHVPAFAAALLTGCEAVFVPGWYEDSVQAGLRLLVQAELREAQRLGLISIGEETPPSITEAQRRMIEQAIEEATVGEVDRTK